MIRTVRDTDRTIARWETANGRRAVILERFPNGGYGYQGDGCGGAIFADTDDAAIADMQTRVESGYFLPDNHKGTMRRVGLTAYGAWCAQPELCRGRGYCPRNPTCAD